MIPAATPRMVWPATSSRLRWCTPPIRATKRRSTWTPASPVTRRIAGDHDRDQELDDREAEPGTDGQAVAGGGADIGLQLRQRGRQVDHGLRH